MYPAMPPFFVSSPPPPPPLFPPRFGVGLAIHFCASPQFDGAGFEKGCASVVIPIVNRCDGSGVLSAFWNWNPMATPSDSRESILAAPMARSLLRWLPANSIETEHSTSLQLSASLAPARFRRIPFDRIAKIVFFVQKRKGGDLYFRSQTPSAPISTTPSIPVPPLHFSSSPLEATSPGASSERIHRPKPQNIFINPIIHSSMELTVD